jgi:hypothetical protein
MPDYRIIVTVNRAVADPALVAEVVHAYAGAKGVGDEWWIAGVRPDNEAVVGETVLEAVSGMDDRTVRAHALHAAVAVAVSNNQLEPKGVVGVRRETTGDVMRRALDFAALIMDGEIPE